jgi:hypothetical protein
MYRQALADATKDLGAGASEMAITQLADAYFTKMQATPTPLEITNTPVIPVITDITTVITDEAEKAEIDNQKLIDAFRTNIQDLNSECRNYETNNGKPDTIVERIADKLVKLYRFSKEHEAIIPPNVFKNFSKAYDRAYAIVKQSKERKEGSEL